jgi:hypothetical protein
MRIIQCWRARSARGYLSSLLFAAFVVTLLASLGSSKCVYAQTQIHHGITRAFEVLRLPPT